MKYPNVMTPDELLEILEEGRYHVCPQTGELIKQIGVGGRVITPAYDKSGRAFVRLYANNKRKTIFLNRLVWMSVTKSVIPEGFEIHHWDSNHANNAFDNLYCLHKMDHDKVHRLQTRLEVQRQMEEDAEQRPFDSYEDLVNAAAGDDEVPF